METTKKDGVSSVVNDGRESGRYLRALREHWPYILGTVVLALVAALLYVNVATKRYDAGADVLVTPVPSQTFVGVPLFRETDLSRSVVTAARLVTSPQVVDGVKRRLRLDAERGELRSHVSVTPQEQSSILTITGKAATPDEAARIANAFADILIGQRTAELQREVRGAVARISRQIKTLQAQGADAEATALADQLSALRTLIGARDPTLQVVSRAVPPEQAAWPRPVLSIAVALLAGLLLGLGIAIGIELVNPLVLTETDVLEPGGPPVLARVPRAALNRVQTYLLPRSSNAPLTSTIPYRGLWATLSVQGEARRAPETVLLTSADHTEDASSVAIGLAVAVALTGRRVVLVDADTRVAAIGRTLEIPRPRGGGLRAVLVDDVALDEVLVPTQQLGDRLRVLPSRPRDDTLLGLVPPEQINALVEELARVADVVVLAAPPLLDAPDALTLAEAVDAVAVTIELGHTRRARVAELRRDLAQRGIVPAGFVVIGRRRGARDWTWFRRSPARDADRLGSTPVEREPAPH